jgi:hypothetical protein
MSLGLLPARTVAKGRADEARLVQQALTEPLEAVGSLIALRLWSQLASKSRRRCKMSRDLR